MAQQPTPLVIAVVLNHATDPQGGSISSFEIGYVFDRDLEYRSGRGNTNLPETFFIRWVTRKSLPWAKLALGGGV